LPPATYCFWPWSGCTWCRPGPCRRGAWRIASWPACAANWWGCICRGAWFVLRPSGILFRRSRTVSLKSSLINANKIICQNGQNCKLRFRDAENLNSRYFPQTRE